MTGQNHAHAPSAATMHLTVGGTLALVERGLTGRLVPVGLHATVDGSAGLDQWYDYHMPLVPSHTIAGVRDGLLDLLLR